MLENKHGLEFKLKFWELNSSWTHVFVFSFCETCFSLQVRKSNKLALTIERTEWLQLKKIKQTYIQLQMRLDLAAPKHHQSLCLFPMSLLLFPWCQVYYKVDRLCDSKMVTSGSQKYTFIISCWEERRGYLFQNS